MVQILTEEELLREWKLTTPKQIAAFKRLLSKDSSKKFCPRYINPRDIIAIGDEKRFYFDPENNRPGIKWKKA